MATPPNDPGALESFPRRVFRAGVQLHRIHHANLGPCWFSAVTDGPGGGRFDLSPPKGSSYWALQPEAAFLESIARRPVSVIPLELLDRFQHSTVALPGDLLAANTPVKRARGFGLTGEFHTTSDYAITRGWAAALAKAKFEALVAIPRHDVTARLRTVAIFGRAGEHVPKRWRKSLESGPLSSKLVDSMSSWGIKCLPIPFDVETTDPI